MSRLNDFGKEAIDVTSTLAKYGVKAIAFTADCGNKVAFGMVNMASDLASEFSGTKVKTPFADMGKDVSKGISTNIDKVSKFSQAQIIAMAEQLKSRL